MSDVPPNPVPEPPPLPRRATPEPPAIPRKRGRFRRPSTEPRVPFFKRFTNALLGWEVLRAGRRTGSIAVARTVLGGSLLVAIWVLYAARFGDEASMTATGTEIGRQLNRFAEGFAITFFVVQATTVLLLTPVYVAGAIFEERDTRSGEVLLTTQLTRREVYVGKLGARMVQVLLVVFAGMPILFLTSLWGGVGVEMILISYTATFTAIVGAGVVTAAISAYAETMRSALLRTYLMLFLLDILVIPASPYLVILLASLHWAAGLLALVFYGVLQLLIVICGYYIGQRWLRMAMLRQKRSLKPRMRGAETISKLPPLHDDTDPLLWKEINAGGRVRLYEGLTCFSRLPIPNSPDDLDEMGFVRWFVLARDGSAYTLRVVLAFFTLLFLALAMLDVLPGEWAARVCGLILVCWMMAAVGLTAAGGIAKERQKQTLLDLLMLPSPRRRLLQAKFLGALLRAMWPFLFLVVLLGAITLSTNLAVVSFLLLVPTAVGFAVFAAGLGIWVSARCRSALNATAVWLGIVCFVILGTFLLAEAQMTRVHDGPLTKWDYPTWSRVVNPGLAWAKLNFRYEYSNYRYVGGPAYLPWRLAWTDVGWALACPFVYGLLGLGCYGFAVRRFEREGRA